jgi:hypothetical protein
MVVQTSPVKQDCGRKARGAKGRAGQGSSRLVLAQACKVGEEFGISDSAAGLFRFVRISLPSPSLPMSEIFTHAFVIRTSLQLGRSWPALDGALSSA